MKSKLTKGTKIYYNGDMANIGGIGTITEEISDKWGDRVNITMDDGRVFAGITVAMFSYEYLGHGGTRFVTLEAYKAYRAEQLDAMQRAMG